LDGKKERTVKTSAIKTQGCQTKEVREKLVYYNNEVATRKQQLKERRTKTRGEGEISFEGGCEGATSAWKKREGKGRKLG